MKIYRLRCELLTSTRLQETFAVFQDPYNLAKITPPSLGFEVTSRNRVVMQRGAEIEYRIRWLGLPMHWKTIILEYDPPFSFLDMQAKGPYALWRHRHTFEETSNGTKVCDYVEYALPFGPLGQVAHATFVKRQLLQIFEYRQRELGKLLAGETTQTVAPFVAST